MMRGTLYLVGHMCGEHEATVRMRSCPLDTGARNQGNGEGAEVTSPYAGGVDPACVHVRLEVM